MVEVQRKTLIKVLQEHFPVAVQFPNGATTHLITEFDDPRLLEIRLHNFPANPLAIIGSGDAIRRYPSIYPPFPHQILYDNLL